MPSEKVNRFIPLVVSCVGIVAACLAEMAVSLDTVVCGMVSGLASSGLYELFAQFIEKAGIIKGNGEGISLALWEAEGDIAGGLRL